MKVPFHRGLLWVLSLLSMLGVQAQETLRLEVAGATAEWFDRSADYPVFLAGLRTNRAEGGWRVELSVSNRIGGEIPTPWIVVLEPSENVVGVERTSRSGAFLVLGPFEQAPRPESLRLTVNRGVPTLRARLFAGVAGVTHWTGRVVDEDGIPLGAAEVQGIGSEVTSPTPVRRGGWFSIPVETRTRGWRITAPGRHAAFRARSAVMPNVPDAVVLASSNSPTTLAVFELPSPLPAGWTPVASGRFAAGRFELGAPEDGAQPEGTAVVVWDEERLAWRILDATDRSAVHRGELPAAGVVARIRPDVGLPGAGFAVGTLLDGPVAGVGTGAVTATGRLEPPNRIASTNRLEVLTRGFVLFRSTSAPLPSGTAFRCEVRESYQLRDGTRRVLPGYTTLIRAYRTTADDGTVLRGEFPLRPTQLLGGGDLLEALIRVDVLADGDERLATSGAPGGVVESGGVHLAVPADTIPGGRVLRLHLLDASLLSGAGPVGLPVSGAFELDVPEVAPGARIGVTFSNTPPNRRFVLARAVFDAGAFGYQPVLRMRSDAAGVAMSEEPVVGGLGGLDGTGQHLLLEVGASTVPVRGVVRDSGGRPAAGLVVRSGPWTALTGSDGRYELLAIAGTAVVNVLDRATGDTGIGTVPVGTDGAPATLNLDVSPRGPFVVSVSPTNGAVNVARVSSVTVSFSRPLNPATVVTAGAVQLADTNGVALPASVSLNLAGDTLTLLPSVQLPPSMPLTLRLDAGLQDRTARPLEGVRAFSFTTEGNSLRRPEAILTIYEPVKGMAGMSGGAGLAEPDSPVILVNETTGVTATVLSRPDGSFTNSIPAALDDELVAVLVNLNGTRNRIRPSSQILADGSVGVFDGGATVTTASPDGPVSLTLEPGSSRGRTVLKLTPLEVASATNGVPGPEGFAGVAAAVDVKFTGDEADGYAGFSVPFSPDRFGVPPGVSPTNMTFALAIMRVVDGEPSYQIVDQLRFQDGQLSTAQANGFPGWLEGLRQDTNALFVPPERLGGASAEFAKRAREEDQPKVLGFLLLAFEQFRLAVLAAMNPPFRVEGKVGLCPAQVEGQCLDAQADPFFAAAGEVTGSLPAFSEFGVLDEIVNLSRLPLAGSIVDATMIVGAARSPQDRFTRGIPYAVADQGGRYSLLLPTATDAYLMRARHPFHRHRDFGPMNPILSSGLLIPVARRNFTLLPDTGVNLPPVVRVTHSPLFPSTNETVEIRIDVLHARASTATAVLVLEQPVSPNGPTNGPPLTADDVVRTQPVADASNSTPTRARFKATVRTVRPLSARFHVTGVVQPPAGATTGPLTASEPFAISFSSQPSRNAPIQSDPLDRVGPSLVRTEPVSGGMLISGEPIRLVFNEPVDSRITNNVANFTITPSTPGSLVVRLSADQTVLELLPPSLQPDTEYRIRYLSPVSDIAGNALQTGTLSGTGLDIRFRTPVVRSAVLPGIDSGGGTVSHGSHIYALDRGGNGRLVVFDASVPVRPVEIASLALPGFPRDLEFIPNWSYYMRRPSLTPGEQPRTNRNLLAIVGGSTGTLNTGPDRIDFQKQYLRVYDVTNPGNPERIASSEITVGPSAVQKVTWHPPQIAFFENGADLQQIAVLDLQAYILAYNTPIPERRSFPDEFVVGRDGSGLRPDGTTNATPNGNYTDAGDELPRAERFPVIFHAQVAAFGISPLDGTRRILDYDYDIGANLGVIVFAGGESRGGLGGLAPGTPLKPGFRVAYFNGSAVGTRSEVLFEGLARPKRVFLTGTVDVSPTAEPDFRDLAFVSLSPDSDGKARLAVIDVTDPFLPVEINAANRAELPSELGLPQSVYRLPGGHLALAMTSDALILDPTLVLRQHTGPGLHPMFRGSLPRAGSGNQTLAVSSVGIMAPSLGSRNEVVQFAPRLSIVQFAEASFLATNGPGASQYAGTNVIKAAEIKGDEAKLRSLRSVLETRGSVGPASVISRSSNNPTLLPPTRSAHYYVLLEAPGGAGAEVSLGLQSLNRAGLPLKNKGRDFPSVRAVGASANSAILQRARAGCDAEVREFKAFRLSDDPKSEFFNLYLSDPFALTGDRVGAARLAEIQSVLPRAVLWSAFGLSAFIDPSMESNPVLGPYAARVTGFDASSTTGDIVIRPRVEAVAETWPATYLPGDSPPPIQGHQAIPGTFGLVNAENGEIRSETADISIPGRGMPVVFSRHYGGQDLYEGPFGHGWDFFHNQQVVPLRPQTFGSRTELVRAVNRLTNSVGQTPPFAQSGDLLFSDGKGHLIAYVNAGGVPPREVASDPLVTALRWREQAKTYYLPSTNSPGVFDPIFEFRDGSFARLTPAGEQFWYDRTGRLTKIYDAHTANFHEMVYNERSDLTRIIDRSVPDGRRFLEIGYYRMPADQFFVADTDARTNAVHVAGKIARLRDYAGRSVDFVYDGDGILKYRIGIAGDGANNGSRERPLTEYLEDGCSGILGGLTAGGEPGEMDSALFATSVDESNQKAGRTGNGVGGPLTMTFPSSSTEPTKSTGPDGAETEMKFDARGYLTERVEKGPEAGAGTNTYAYNAHGQMTNSVAPLGDRTEYLYDSGNPTLRSRGNLLLIRHVPGRRGGPTIRRSMPQYDLRHNLPTGETRDFNDFTHTIQLTRDGREVESIAHQEAGSTRFSYNEYGQLLGNDMPDGVHVGYEYDGASGFATKRFQGGNKTVLTYDGSTAAKLGSPTTIRPDAGAGVTVTYDARLLPTSVIRGGSVQKFGYDANGNMVYREIKVGAIATRVERREYNRINFLEKLTVENVDVGGIETDVVTRFISSPQDAWRVRAIVHETGGQTRLLDYDHFGRVRRNTLGTYVEETEYDLHGNPESFKQGGVTTRTMSYDGHDRLTGIVSRASASRDETVVRGYHPGGELKSLVVSDSDFGENYNLLIDRIDSLGRPRSRKIKGSDSDATTELTYPAGEDGGSMVADGPRDRTEMRHDKAGYQTGLTSHLTSSTFEPDANGNITGVLSNEGARTYRTAFGFNDLDQLDRVDDDLGLVSDPDPRIDGSNETVTDGRGKAVTQEFTNLGELRRQRRGNGVEFNFRRDANRQVTLSGDAALKGHVLEYDTATTRPTAFRLRSQQPFLFNQPNHLNLPEEIGIPGGKIKVGYDDQGRTVSRDADYAQGLPYKATLKHDGLGRVRESAYGRDGRNVATFKYDLLGPLTEASYTEPHGTFTVTSTLNTDGSRRTLHYPSGIKLVEDRDPAGRLETVRSQGGGDLYRVTRFAGASERAEVNLGDGTILETALFDMRRQNTARTFVRGSDRVVLADIRYRYDQAGNIVARQEVHRHGRADIFGYDDGNRLARADIGLRPPVRDAIRSSAAGLTNVFGLEPGRYARNYLYDGSGLDLLERVETVNPNPLAVVPIPFVQSLRDPDSMLFPTRVDGVARGGPDPLGNTTDTRLLITRPGGLFERVPAVLKYTAFSQLAEIRRNDGVLITYEHQPNGLVHRRTLTGGGNNLDSAFVWDESRLLEEYGRDGNNSVLRARYYYADEDSPFAADLRDPVTGALQRFWYLRDALSTVVALADEDGVVVERYRYDPWGQPVIEGRDGRPPRIAFVSQSAGSLLVQFSEPVLPPFRPEPPGDLPDLAGSLAVDRMDFPRNFIRVQTVGGLASARLEYEEDLPGGFPFGTLVRVTPQTTAALVGLSVDGGAVTDEWGNGNIAESVVFSGPGGSQPLYEAPGALQDSRPPQLPRSAAGSPMLFHGQYWDAEGGLLYLRARFYDPSTGMFLQQDPEPYIDSPNSYASFGQSPTSSRDPSGRSTGDALKSRPSMFKAGSSKVADMGEVKPQAAPSPQRSRPPSRAGQQPDQLTAGGSTPAARPRPRRTGEGPSMVNNRDIAAARRARGPSFDEQMAGRTGYTADEHWIKNFDTIDESRYWVGMVGIDLSTAKLPGVKLHISIAEKDISIAVADLLPALGRMKVDGVFHKVPSSGAQYKLMNQGNTAGKFITVYIAGATGMDDPRAQQVIRKVSSMMAEWSSSTGSTPGPRVQRRNGSEYVGNETALDQQGFVTGDYHPNMKR